MKTRWPGDLFDNIQQRVTWHNDFVTCYTNVEHKRFFIYIWTCTHPGINSVVHLRQVECRQQQQDGDDNMVSLFVLKVWHQVNTVNQLWLLLGTEHQWHRVCHSSSCCIAVLCQIGTWSSPRVQKMWAQQSLISRCCTVLLFLLCF